MAVQVDLPLPQQDTTDMMGTLFAEELGLVLEVAASQEAVVLDAYQSAGLSATRIGSVSSQPSIEVAVGGQFAIAGAFQAQTFNILLS